MRVVPVSTDVRSFIDMMSSLFQSPSVYLRELLQNALEATFQAERHGESGTPVRITTDATGAGALVAVVDKGIGMTADELANSLGSVFFSGWPTAVGETLGIGQFGFGFYTIFLAAERAVVTSRALHEPGRAHRWTLDRGSGHAAIEEIPGPLPEIGTTVEIHLDEDHRSEADHDHVLNNLRQQYLYVPYPVFVNGVPLGLPRLEGWRAGVFGRGATAGSALAERHGWPEPPLVVAPVEIDNGGVLVVVPDGVTAPALEVYRRGVRVTQQEIVPQPLNMFVCGVIDMTDISLKPDRESLRQDANFDRLRHGIAESSADMLIGLAQRDRTGLGRVFEAHDEHMVSAMLRNERLRRALGRHVPMPLYFPDRRHGQESATMHDLDMPGTGGRLLQWAHDRAADQLFADRARHLGAKPVFLRDRKLHRLVSSICADQDVSLRHVAMNYLREVERSTRRDDALRSLFGSVVGDGWDVMCVDDADSRVPLRLVQSPFADESPFPGPSDDDFATPEAALALLVRMLGHVAPEPDDVRIVVVNTTNPMIRDLCSSLPSAPPHTLRQFAEIMLALAKFAAQTSIDPREFEKLNRDVLAVLHERILQRPARRRFRWLTRSRRS